MFDKFFSKLDIKYINKIRLKSIIINILTSMIVTFLISNAFAAIIYNNANRKSSLLDAAVENKDVQNKNSSMFSKNIFSLFFLDETKFNLESKEKIYKNGVFRLTDNKGHFEFENIDHNFYIGKISYNSITGVIFSKEQFTLNGDKNGLLLTVDEFKIKKDSDLKKIKISIKNLDLKTNLSKLKFSETKKEEGSDIVNIKNFELKSDNPAKEFSFYGIKLSNNKKIKLKSDFIDYNLKDKIINAKGNVELLFNDKVVFSQKMSTFQQNESDKEITQIRHSDIKKSNSETYENKFIKTLIFTDNVHFVSPKYTLDSNYLVFDQIEEFFYAYDNLKIKNGENYTSAYFFVYDLKNDEGYFINELIYKEKINENGLISYNKIKEFLNKKNKKSIFNIEQKRDIEKQVVININENV